MDTQIQKWVSVIPTERQKSYEKMGFNVFFHYGMNTFTGKEWGDGKASPALFNPKNQDTDQWVKAAKDAGAKGVILTCKHHDGFCLWPTKTTEYSVKNSPYKNGKGDVVKEVADSCKKFGIKFGVYLSPWDRNSEYYGTPKYNDFYIEQLTELLTGYGDIFCVWLDGACGSYLDGKAKQVYDFNRIYATVRELQPGACISNCGPDIRWVGNEGGYARESEWNVVPAFQFNTQNIAEKSQQDEDGAKMQSFDAQAEDLGSRAVLQQYDDFIWYPSEVDVSIRPGWFYHKNQDKAVRSLKNLLHIYYTSVGGNSLLLLNIPPNKEGLLASADVKRLKELGEEIQKAFAMPMETKEADDILSVIEEQDSYSFSWHFETGALIDKVVLEEDCDFSQRVEKFSLYISYQEKEQKVYDGTIIGFQKIALFDAKMADAIRLEITECRSIPHLKSVVAYQENGGVPKFSKWELFLRERKKKARQKAGERWAKQQAKKKAKVDA